MNNEDMTHKESIKLLGVARLMLLGKDNQPVSIDVLEIADYNEQLSQQVVQVEELETHDPRNRVYKCCKCGQFFHRTNYCRPVKYCTFCGGAIKWEDVELHQKTD